MRHRPWVREAARPRSDLTATWPQEGELTAPLFCRVLQRKHCRYASGTHWGEIFAPSKARPREPQAPSGLQAPERLRATGPASLSHAIPGKRPWRNPARTTRIRQSSEGPPRPALSQASAYSFHILDKALVSDDPDDPAGHKTTKC
ncbi:hypothetical protein NDU88_008969 [Pleurodeles waltl]|uniref:Uncharacterized protein n=1 Tax=Pleurodeles waltl TaxID=8319 RepID=A0AAV7QQ74_PLEWA|nr:hypothetical protein NDU88_008969 [Pleurodeles waltl]